MVRRALAALSLLVCASALAQEPLPPGLHGVDKLAALVQRVSQVQASVATLDADFEQVRTSRLLVAPSVSRGRFHYRAPDSVRWDYDAPREMTVLLTGGVAITYRPAEKRAERIEVGRAQRRVFRFLAATEPLDKLMQHFSFAFRDPLGPGNYILELKPEAHMIKKRLRQVRIEIERTTFLPIKVGYTEADGDSTQYAFSNVKLNSPQSPDLYTLNIPPDVEVVQIKLADGE
ncbi:MAG TPA: outer membrane lipoprotein carrier protein LolA [Thermoanaerobaculaceae bacterium]|nr:outer membrane lipoprotein carrier protein LolA [Thermoanaerobaculaceae bacterium]